MTAGVVVAGGRVVCQVPRPAACRIRGEALRRYARAAGITGQLTGDPDIIMRRMVWDAPAAAEYPRPILSDCVDAAALRPDLAGDIWHAAAGAIITAPGCDCDTPAGHRDVFAAIGRTIGATTGADVPARYACKACGAESPTGIGYAATTAGPMPAPAADCGHPHALEVTR